MHKAHEYHQHARQCRRMAARANSDEHKVMLIEMAATWDKLAVERAALLERKDRNAAIEATARGGDAR